MKQAESSTSSRASRLSRALTSVCWRGTDSQAEPNVEDHIFNDDLLANEGDLDLATTTYPELVHVLEHKDLQQIFWHYDRPANEAKARSHFAGLLALWLGVIALIGASSEPLIADLAHLSKLVGLVAAASGISSVFIGMWGLLYAKPKRRWLRQRMMTERLRQLHFQVFACRFTEVAASVQGSVERKRFCEERNRWLSEFMLKFEGHEDSKLSEIIESAGATNPWLHPHLPFERNIPSGVASMLFDAYRVLRIDHQLQYANWKLRDEAGLWSTSPRRQLDNLSRASFLCVMALFVIHLAVAIGISFPVGELFEEVVHSPVAHVAAIWCAIFGLACRVMEDGLGLRHESERYRDYRAAIASIAERFGRETDVSEKIRIMQEMERLSFDEMCSFLRSAHESRFVI